MLNRVKERFALHELWVLDQSESFPFFAPIFVFTFWIWSLPLLPILIFYSFLVVTFPLLTFLPSIVLGMALAFFVAPWFFRWFFISVGLRFGKNGMASEKRKEIERRLMQ